MDEMTAVLGLTLDIEGACAEHGVTEEAIVRMHVLALAMRFTEFPEGEQDRMYGLLVNDIKNHARWLLEAEALSKANAQ